MRLKLFFVNTFSRFLHTQSGAIGLLFGLMAIPLLLGAGLAIDYANYARIQNQVQAAVDAAVLAAASSEGSQEERIALAQRYFETNMGSLMTGYNAKMEVKVDTPTQITIQATLDSPNYLMKLAGIDKTPMQVSASAMRENQGIEVALIFDTTGSMEGLKLQELQNAARTFTDILFGNKNISQSVKIGIVPFSTSVNVGPDKGASFGIDVDGRSSVNTYNFIHPINDRWYNMRAWNSISNLSWTGCVEARAGQLAFDDTPPNPGNPETLFTPYFSPDEPGPVTTTNYRLDVGGKTYYYINSWKDDVFAKGQEANVDLRQRSVEKYNKKPISKTSRNGPSQGCPDTPILPLTNKKSEIMATLNALTAKGPTVIVEGVMWGYRVLSPAAPYTEGTEFHKPGVHKVAILLSDGTNDVGDASMDVVKNQNGSVYSAYGYASQGRLGTTSLLDMTDRMNKKTVSSCQMLKSQGVTVYTLYYDLGTKTNLDILTDCASDPGKALSVTPATIEREFSDLAMEIKKLHLSK